MIFKHSNNDISFLQVQRKHVRVIINSFKSNPYRITFLRTLKLSRLYRKVFKTSLRRMGDI